MDNDGRLSASQLVPSQQVQMACQEAATALDRLARVLTETPMDDPSIGCAAPRLEMTVSVLRRTPCEGLVDMREKCRIFRRLQELLSPADPMLGIVACDLVWEMAEVSTDKVEGVVSGDASRRVRRRSAVQTACQEAAAATDTFVSLLDEASAAERVRLQLDMALSVFRCASCEGLADMRAKCRTFRRLEDLLSPSDPRLGLVACDLVREMTDLLEEQDVRRIASETVAQVDPDLLQRGAAAEPRYTVLTAIQDIFRLDRPKFMRARTTRQGDRA